MTEIFKQLVDDIYDHVLTVVNRALHNAQNYSIAILKLEDPSYAQIVEQLRKACELMDVLSDQIPPKEGADQVYTVTKAKEYAENVAKIAAAIEAGDEEALKRHCEELERRPFL